MVQFDICWTYNNFSVAIITLIRGLLGQCGMKGIELGRGGSENGMLYLHGNLQANHD
jgi:hypothetical protein